MALTKFDGSTAAATAAPSRDYYGTSGQDTITGTSLNESLWGGQGDRLVGGAGDDTYYLLNVADVVVEFADVGADRIVSWGSVSLLDHPNVENVSVGADDRYAAGNALDNIVEGMEGRQQIYGGLGQDVLIGGAGADVFIVFKGEGNDVIQDFSVVEDKLRLKAGYSTFAEVQSHMSQVGADVLIDLGGGDGLFLRNVQAGQLTSTNFQLQMNASQLGALTFADEFNGPISFWDAAHSPDGIWRADYGYQGQNGFGSYTLASNGELQIYTSPYFRDHNGDFAESPFVVNPDGTMSIWAKPSTNPEIFGYGYTSGVLTTKESFAQTYGYFEIRADVPEAAGAWPAFWLVPNDGSWPPELDVMETLSGDPNQAWTSAHSSNGGHTATGQANYIPDTADGMHTYGALWTPTDLVYYIDGVEVFRTATPSDMNKPMHMIVNLALGGWAGALDTTALPAEYRIDYVRAYALPTPGTGGTMDTGGAATGGTVDTGGTGTGGTVDSGGTGTGGTVDTGGTGDTSGSGGSTTVSTSASSYTLTPTDIDVLLTGSRQTVIGNDAANVMTSNNNINTLIGGGGGDSLISGRDADTLTGGAGADRFVYLEIPWNGTRITDFTSGEDQIEIGAALAKLGYSGTDPVADGWLKIDSNGAGGARVWIDPDGSGAIYNYWLVATVDGVSPASLQVNGGVITGGVTVSEPPAPAPAPAPAPTPPPPPPVTPAEVHSLPESGAWTQTLTGTAKNNTLTGTDANELIDGKGGTDTLSGGGGDDTYLVHSTRDTIRETATGGIDTVKTALTKYSLAENVENVILTATRAQNVTGNTSDNLMKSNANGSTLNGGGGNDVLVAGTGGDIFTGGAGDDVFRFDFLPAKAVKITDFTIGYDVIDLRGVLSGYAGTDPIADGYVRFENDGLGGANVFVDLDGAGASPLVHAITLTGVDPQALTQQQDWVFL